VLEFVYFTRLLSAAAIRGALKETTVNYWCLLRYTRNTHEQTPCAANSGPSICAAKLFFRAHRAKFERRIYRQQITFSKIIHKIASRHRPDAILALKFARNL
jgi:hypothetical protein